MNDVLSLLKTSCNTDFISDGLGNLRLLEHSFYLLKSEIDAKEQRTLHFKDSGRLDPRYLTIF